MSVTLGQVVISKAGRDTGRKFVVIGVVDDMYVQISDGDLRRVEKPKKKKVRHLEPVGRIAGVVLEKLTSGARVSNAEIRKSLAGLEEPRENEE